MSGLNGKIHVSVRIARTVGERTLDMTLHGTIDGAGTFHYFSLGRGGQEQTIPNAWGLVIKPEKKTLKPNEPVPPETQTGFEYF